MAENKEEKKENKVSGTSTEALAFLSIIAKNFLYIPKIMGDTNKTRNSIVKLVKLKGGEATEKADKSFLQEDSAEVELQKQKDKYQPTPVKNKNTKNKPKKKSTGIFGKIFDMFKTMKSLFSIGNIIKLIAGAGLLVGIISYFWDSIVEAWEEWKESSGIWETITEGLDTVTDFFVNLIGKDTIDDISTKVKDFFKPVTKAVGDFFYQFTDWFSEKFDDVRKFLGIPIPEKKIKPAEIEIPIDEKTQKEDNSLMVALAESRKEQAKAQESESKEQEKKAEEVRAAYEKEEAVKYHGEDEIVRQRMGLEEKSAKKMAEEYGVETQDGKPKPVTQEAKPAEAKPQPVPKETPTKPSPVPAATGSGDDKWIMDMIKNHEGMVPFPYKDSLGLWTIGVGHLIGDGKSLPKEFAAWSNNGAPNDKKNNRTPALTPSAIDALFASDYEHHKQMAMKMPGFDKVNKATQGALIDLAFNMGGSWYKKWPGFMKAFVAGNMQEAAEHLQNSKWYQQVKGRAVAIVNLIRTGSLVSPSPVNNKITPTSADTKKQAAAASVAPTNPSVGSAVSATSAEVAAGQRKQQTANAPVVINAPTTNNTTVNQTVQQKQASPPYSTSNLIGRQAQ